MGYMIYLTYTPSHRAYFIQWTGLTDWTRRLDSYPRADKKGDGKIQVIMMTVVAKYPSMTGLMQKFQLE